MKSGKVSVTVRPIKKDDGTYEFSAEFAYHLSDEERETLESLTDEQKSWILEELNRRLNSEAHKRAYEAAERFVMYGF